MTQTGEERLEDRIMRQVCTGRIDRERLLPHQDKRRHDLLKKQDKPIETNGWRIFVAAQAYAILNGKAPQRRNAELMLLEMAMRWRRDVLELLPDRVGDREKIVSIGIANPAPLPNKK